MLRVMPQDWEPMSWAEQQAQRVALEVRRLRGSRSAQWLSDQTEQYGYRVSRSVIADLENGRRKYVTTAEMIVLAYALQTSPVGLLFPPPYDDEQVDLMPDWPMTKLAAAEAFCGISPYVNRLVDMDTMRPLRRAREIASLEDRQEWLLIQLEEFGKNDDFAGSPYQKSLEDEMERVLRRLAEVKAERDGTTPPPPHPLAKKLDEMLKAEQDGG